MTFPCPNSAPCTGDDNPLSNFSSEAADPPIRLGYSTGASPTSSFRHFGGAGPVSNPPSGPGPADPPGPLVQVGADTGTGGDPPPLGSDWENAVVTTFVEVTDPDVNPADEAGNENVEQLFGPGGGTDTGGYRQPNGLRYPTFTNQPQTCTIVCSDGNPFSFTVPQGAFIKQSQALADSAAFSFACKQAYRNRVCLTNIDSTACVGSGYNQFIIADAANIPIDFAVISGVFPSWLTASVGPISIHLTGNPTTSDIGSSTFTVRAIDVFGFTMTKDYTITVAECNEPCMITTSVMSAFDQGQPYSEAITVTGGTAPYTFSIVSGTLPDGLSLSSSGVVSGTASLTNGNLDKTFTVSVSDSSSPSQFCTGVVTLPVLDYHNYPPGKKWRLQGYTDGSISAGPGCCNVAAVLVWSGTFDTQAGSAWFRGGLSDGITGHSTTMGLITSSLGGSPEWWIFLDCATVPANSPWRGRKVGSNAGVKLDSPAGVYTIEPVLGGKNLCDFVATLTIEEY